MAPVATPCCTAFGPLYRNSVAAPIVETTDSAEAGAPSDASIGTASTSPLGSGGVTGAEFVRVTPRVALLVFPTESVAITVIAFEPVTSATEVENARRCPIPRQCHSP